MCVAKSISIRCSLKGNCRHFHKWEEAIESAKSFFSHLVPKISIGTDSTNEVSIDFDWEEVKRNPDEVLDLAEKIAKKKGLKIVICVDEFQNIAEFTDPDYFQKNCVHIGSCTRVWPIVSMAASAT